MLNDRESTDLDTDLSRSFYLRLSLVLGMVLMFAALLTMFGCLQNNPQNMQGSQGESVEAGSNHSNLTEYIQPNSWVTIDYVAFLENGSLYDTTIEEIALEHNFSREKFGPEEYVVNDKAPAFVQALTVSYTHLTLPTKA